jgi:hypothetical protein
MGWAICTDYVGRRDISGDSLGIRKDWQLVSCPPDEDEFRGLPIGIIEVRRAPAEPSTMDKIKNFFGGGSKKDEIF